MGLLDLLKQSEAAAPKARKQGNDGPRLYIMDMSNKPYTDGNNEYHPGNQGTIKFFPIQGIDGKDIKYAYDVKKYRYETPEDEEGNSRIVDVRYMDPKDYQMALSDDEKAKILKVRSLIDYFAENINGFPDAETKNYALIFGYILEHQSKEGDVLCGKDQDGNVTRKMALMYFPSKNFAKAMTGCLQDMAQMGEELSAEMYSDLFSRKPERTVYLQITFEKSEGFGYDCTIQAKPIDRYAMGMLTPDELKAQSVTIPQEQIDFCTSISAIFFAGNRQGLDQFNTTGEIFSPNDFDGDYTDGVIKQIEDIINGAEAAEKAKEDLPPIPSKNKKKKSDLDAE